MSKRIDYKNYYDDIQALLDKGIGGYQIAKILCTEYDEFIGRNYRNVYRNIQGVVKKLEENTSSETSSNEYPTKGRRILSAIGDDGKIMSIDKYCDYHNLPRNQISSYKLITHTGIPYYNTVFHENKEFFEIDFESIVSKYFDHNDWQPKYTDFRKKESDYYSRVVYTDVHINMNPNPDGTSLYDFKWKESDIIDRAEEMCNKIADKCDANVLIVDDLGDLMDGQGGQTLRKGHTLPQYWSDEKAFDVALKFKIFIADKLSNVFSKVIFNNIVNDNHSGAYSYYVNKSVQSILKYKYPDFEYNIFKKFIDHYFIGYHCFILCHGKDKGELKHGLKVNPSFANISFIDKHCKAKDIYKKAKYISFNKGDSHQLLFDYCSSDDFDYLNYPAFSPPSKYIQTNYGKTKSGFVTENFHAFSSGKDVNIHFFE